MKWMVGRYCKTLSPPRRRQFELKVAAESLFKGFTFLHRLLFIIKQIEFLFFLNYFS